MKPAPRANRGHERGSGVVLILGAVAVVVTIAWALLILGGALLSMNRAAVAADLAAVAGAQELRAGGTQATACAKAGQVAADNGASLTACSATPGAEARIAVTALVALPDPVAVLGLDSASARARAGLVCCDGPTQDAPRDGGVAPEP